MLSLMSVFLRMWSCVLIVGSLGSGRCRVGRGALPVELRRDRGGDRNRNSQGNAQAVSATPLCCFEKLGD